MNQWGRVEQVFIALVYDKIRSRNVNEIESQLKLYDVSKHYPDFLRKVVDYNFIECVHLFASCINVPLSHKNEYALHLATSAEMVNELISLGARLNVKCVGGRSPLHTAIMKAESRKVVQALLRHGIDVDVCDSRYSTPLDEYCRRNVPYDFIFWFVETCNPSITPGVLNSCTRSKILSPYFFKQLPDRQRKCRRIVLLLIWSNAFRQKDVSLMVSRLVWQTRRQPCWIIG